MAINWQQIVGAAPPPEDVEAAQRRLALAEALQAKAIGGSAPRGGGRVVAKYSTTGALADLANTLVAKRNVSTAEKSLARQKEAEGAKLDKAIKAYRGSVADDQVPQAAVQALRQTPDGQLMEPVTSRSEAVAGIAGAAGLDGRRALAEALMKQGLDESDPSAIADRNLKAYQIQATVDERRAAREQRLIELQARIDDAALNREQRAQAAREMAELRREIARDSNETRRAIADQADATRRAEIDRKIAADDAKRPETTSSEAAAEFLRSINYDPAKGTDDVSPMIQKSTGGAIQKFSADVLGAANITTSGRMEIGKLKSRASDAVLNLLGGKLGAGVSNADREFMLQKVADIGNDSIPTDQRLAGWNDLITRMRAAAGAVPTAGAGATAPPAAPTGATGGWGKATVVAP